MRHQFEMMRGTPSPADIICSSMDKSPATLNHARRQKHRWYCGNSPATMRQSDQVGADTGVVTLRTYVLYQGQKTSLAQALNLWIPAMTWNVDNNLNVEPKVPPVQRVYNELDTNPKEWSEDLPSCHSHTSRLQRPNRVHRPVLPG
jgi:hypothetical protein